MQKIDYTIFYKEKFDDIDSFKLNTEWDIFISAYNDSDRVQKMFQKVSAKEKHWLLLPEYQYELSEVKSKNDVFTKNNCQNESEYIKGFIEHIGLDSFNT